MRRTLRIGDTVPTLTEAWAFVMEHVDEVGPTPSIEITPEWIASTEPDEHEVQFAVVVREDV